jgi:electron transport complex protein RnfD
MWQVNLALLPGIATLFWFYGWGVLINIVIAGLTALASEALILQLRKRAIAPSLEDGSAWLTAMLLGLALPPLAPWWIPVVGAAFAIIVGKQLYGGLGFNPFNPAMLGFALLLVSFPLPMTQWPAANSGLDLSSSLAYVFELNTGLDGITGATPLDSVRTGLLQGENINQISRRDSFAAPQWFWINLLFLAGGLYLLAQRLIQWHIPVAMLAALLIMSGIFHLIDAERYASPLFHLFSGATMVGAFFIATDPVTAATSNKGRLLYGAGIGVLLYVIRSWGGYPDAVAFAVLLMNMSAPTLDYFTQPRVFGGGRHE